MTAAKRLPLGSTSLSSTSGSLKDGGVVPVGMTTLLDETNQPFAAGSLDPEGIALTSSGTVFISSEGDAEQLIKPLSRSSH